MENTDYTSFFSNFPFWEKLSLTQQRDLLSNVKNVHYEAGENIQSDTSQCLGILFLEKGILQVYLLSPDGKEASLYRLHDGDVCTLSAACVMAPLTFDVYVDAITPCQGLVLPSYTLKRLMDENVYLENFCYKLTMEHFSDVIQALERTFFLTLPQRIAAFLVDESSMQNSSYLAITQEQLAKDIGSAREAVSRALKQMAAEGSVKVSRGGIEIVNKSLLYEKLS